MIFLDSPELFLFVLFVVIVVAGAGLIKEFNRALKISFIRKKDYTISDMKKSLLAVKIAVYSGLVFGGFTFAVGLIMSFCCNNVKQMR